MFQDPEQHRGAMRQAYYRYFNDEPKFEHDLQALGDRLRPFLTPPRLNAEVADAVNAFLQRWPLGRFGFRDTWYTLTRPNPTTLRQGPRPFDAKGLRTEPLAFPEIQPPTFPAFSYDPTAVLASDVVNFPAALLNEARRLGRQLEQDILDQGKAIEVRAREAGWRRPSRRYRQSGELERLAWRLYARAVEKRTYDAIANTETQVRNRKQKAAKAASLSADAVRLSVDQWATELGVPLP